MMVKQTQTRGNAHFWSVLMLFVGLVLFGSWGEMRPAMAEQQADARKALAKKATKPKAPSREYSLKELLALAWQRSPMVRAARYRLQGFREREKEAFWLSWGLQGNISAMLFPSPPARGNAIRSDTPQPASFLNFSEYGVLTRVDMTLAWPVFTFFKLSKAQEAAHEGVRIGEANIRLERNKIGHLIRKAYYGYQLAESALLLLDEGQGYLVDARKRVKAKTNKLKLKVFETQLQARLNQAQSGKRMAQSTLARLTGIPVNPPIKLKETELDEDPELTVMPLLTYQRLARRYRPELQILKHAVNAKRDLAIIKRRMLLPDFFIAGFFRFAYSNVADDQLSPFARDDFNYIEGGLGLGLRFSLDIPMKLAQARRAEAEVGEIQSQQRMATQGILLQVEKHYRDLVMLQRNLKVLRAGRKAANKWITRTMISYSSGLVELKEVTEALLAASQTRFGFLEALHNYYNAISALSKAVGVDITRPSLTIGKTSSKKKTASTP